MNNPNLLDYLDNPFIKAFVLLSLWGSAVYWLFRPLFIILFVVGLLWIGLNFLQSERNRWLTYLTHSIAVLIPIILTWILYHTVLQGWWLKDDPMLLQHVVEHGILSSFYQNEIWRSLSPVNLTPWVTLSLGIDWHFFGLEPLGYYWHHLLSFTIVLIIAYITLNLFFSPLVCSITLSLFVASVPSANIAQLLMVRHYLEGLGLSLLALLGYVKAVQTQRQTYAYLGCVFYLLATTAKEIYVPLLVVLPCLPLGNWKQRWKMLIPFVAVAGSYVLWRAYMLEPTHILTGYGELYPKLDWDIVLALPNRVVEVLGWQHTWQLLIVLLVGLVYLGAVVTARHNCQGCSLLWLAATFLPIVPVLSMLVPRYLFLPYFVLCLGVAFSLQFFLDKKWHYVALWLGLSLLAVGIKSVESGPTVFRQTELLKQTHLEGEFILMGSHTNALLLNPLADSWHYQSLQWFREHVLKLPKGARVCYDLCVCQAQPTENIYQYVQGQIRTSRLSEHVQDCGQPDAALSVKLRFATDTLHWQLGPYQQGQYYATVSTQQDINDGIWLALPVQQGSYPFELSKTLFLAFKYVSPEGWQTYSPILVLDPAQKDAQGVVQMAWQRD